MQCLFDEDFMQKSFVDELVSFLCVTAVGDKFSDPFDGWRINETQYTHISPLRHDILVIPAPSVCNEEFFSLACNWVEVHRTRF